MMKKLLFTLMFFAFTGICIAQTAIDGDYRSAASGNWSNPTSWQVRSGSTWSAAAVVPTATNNIYIQNAHTITIDVAYAYCKDLQINILGVLAIGTKIMNVNGKIRAYTGAAEVTSSDGTYAGVSSTATASTMITTLAPGVLKFVGGTRNITNSGEWNSSGTGNAAEFALDAGATGTLSTVGVKFKSIVFSSGTVTTDAFISASTGDVTIKSGARLISSRSGSTSSGTTTSTTLIGNSSSTSAGTVTIDLGGVLELTGSFSAISCTTFTNNGTVIYSKAGSQTLLQIGTLSSGATNGSATFNNYSTLIFANTSSKTLSAATTVSKLLQFTGTASLGTTSSILTLTMANNSTIDRSVSSGTSISSGDAVNVFYGNSSTDVVNVNIGTTIAASNEVPANPAPGKVGTLTTANGATYTFTGTRSITDLVNNGSIVLTPNTSLTFTIGGTASGTGLITSNKSTGNLATNSIPEYYSASLSFTNTGSKGTIYLDPSYNELRYLTLTGAGALTLGNSVTLNAPFTLSDNTTLALGLASTVSFASSQAASWTSGKTLTITGWTGTAGSSGTSGKLFFGSTSTDLTAPQINQIVFNMSGINYSAMLLSNGELVPTNTVLPVKLTSFTAQKQGTAVQLKWTTASEQNNSHFEVQRSTDGQSFVSIGSKAGAGNSNSVLDYFFTDNSPLSGVNYYRLNQVDFDGTANTSNPVAVSLGVTNTSVTAYPNPVTQQLNVTGLVAGDHIKLLDLSGRIIKTQDFSGSNTAVLSLDKINAGLYLLVVENAGKLTFQSKIVKN